jgi:hypothetical protein
MLAVFSSLVFAAPAQASPDALAVIVTGNQASTAADLASAIAAEPGVAFTTSFDTSSATPAAATIAEYDLVVSIGDSSYDDAALWGDRLADYVDAGGEVLQAAYDNWDSGGAAPTGRFASGGYAPLLNGPNNNNTLTLGTLVIPDHPLVQGLGTIPTTNNTTTALAPGATLLAKWSNDANAIAFKGRVASISASPDEPLAIPGIARLARNTGSYFASRSVTVAKTGTGLGTVSGAGLLCGTSCSAIFPGGTKLAFAATAAPDSEFKGWTGPCTGVALCEPTVAGANLSLGAVFDLVSFASKTKVTLAARSTKIPKNGQLKIRIRNSNGFSVRATVSGQTASKVRTPSLRLVKLKSKKAALKAKGTKTVVLKLPKSLQKILAEKGKLKLLVTAKVKSPSGKSRTVKKKLTVKPKG